MAKGKAQSEASGSSLENVRSVLTQDDLGMLRGFYFIPSDFRIMLPGPKGRINHPPKACLGVYEEALKAGLHFSLHN